LREPVAAVDTAPDAGCINLSSNRTGNVLIEAFEPASGPKCFNAYLFLTLDGVCLKMEDCAQILQ
jgi:hypothetical protein